MRATGERSTPAGVVCAAALSVLLCVVGCGPEPPPVDGSEYGAAAAATTAADLGGMAELITAAQAEGELNIVAAASPEADHRELISAFETAYNIRVNVAAPHASDEEQIAAGVRYAGTDRAPDVFMVGQDTAAAHAAEHFAEYRVRTWEEVPADSRDPKARYVGGAAARLSLGFAADTGQALRTVSDLGEGQGEVALAGDPQKEEAALLGVVLTAFAAGGGPADLAPGAALLDELDRAGQLRWAAPRRADLAAGATTAVIDWEHASLQRAADLRGVREWEVVVPSPTVGGLVCQAVNQEAPHPAAARLWVEFVLSDEGQNLQFRNASYPVRFAAMHQDGTVDTGERAAGAAEPPLLLTPQQVAQARDTLRAYGIGPGDE